MAEYPQLDSMLNSMLLDDDKEECKEENDIISDKCLDAQRTTSSVFMLECREDNKIKEEIQRLALDRQYKKICNEKQELMQKINEYKQQIEELHAQLIATNNDEGNHTVDNTDASIVQQKQFEKQLEAQQQAAIEKQNELQIALSVVETENGSLRNEISIHEKRHHTVSQEMMELRDNNISLEQTMKSFQSKECELVSKRYEKLSIDFMSLQNEFHATKLKLNEAYSQVKELEQQIHHTLDKMKFVSKELEQSQNERDQMQKHNLAQTEQISQLNHDMKAMFRDLERTQGQLMESQQMIASLEKQYYEQTAQMQSTRNQLQMQIQINMQHLNAMNGLQSTKNIQNNEETEASIDLINAQLTERTMPTNRKQNKMSRRQTTTTPSVIIPDDMELARGKPFYSRQSSANSNGMQDSKKKIVVLLEEKSKLETELFKLPTNPRSLGQRKKKQHLEAAILGIETQIDSIKRVR